MNTRPENTRAVRRCANGFKRLARPIFSADISTKPPVSAIRSDRPGALTWASRDMRWKFRAGFAQSLPGCGIDYQLPAIAGAVTHGSYAGRTVQFQMNDSPLPRRHGIGTKRLTGLAHALGRHARGKFQFRKPGGAIIAAIKAHAIVQSRIEPQPTMPDGLKGQQHFSIALEQKFLIGASKRDQHLRIVN